MLSKTLPFPGPQLYHARAVQVYEDPEIVRLQGQIKLLMQELAELQRIKSEIEQQIQVLHTRHHQELRHLIMELLHLRRSHAQAGRTPSEEQIPDPETLNEGEPEISEAKQPDKLPKLTPAERRSLKEMFRRASKMCHPDLVAAEFKAEAGLIFIELKTAYEQHNLPQVEEILYALERGERLNRKPALSHNKDNLRAEIRYLSQKIQAIQQEIETLKQSNSYKKLANIDDWDDYFDDLKAELQRKINRLRRKKTARAVATSAV